MSIWQNLTCRLMFPSWAFQMTQHLLLACEARNAGSPKDSWPTKSAEMKTTKNKRLSFMTIMCHYYVTYLTIHSHHIKKEAPSTSPGVDWSLHCWWITGNAHITVLREADNTLHLENQIPVSSLVQSEVCRNSGNNFWQRQIPGLALEMLLLPVSVVVKVAVFHIW